MSEHEAEVLWTRATPGFAFEDFNRSHTVRFRNGEIVVPADAGPDYLGAGGADPEAMFAAALAACHMLSFLTVAARMRLVVDAYADRATAVLSPLDGGKAWVSEVVLRPWATFAGEVGPGKLAQLHDLAHRNCFLTNSVKTTVSLQPRF